MRISKTMVEEVDVSGMDAVEVLSEIGSVIGTMRTHCHGLDYVEFIKTEMFNTEVAGDCDCPSGSTSPVHKARCAAVKVRQYPHVRVIVKVGTKNQEEGTE